jgi:hypothetical protein
MVRSLLHKHSPASVLPQQLEQIIDLWRRARVDPCQVYMTLPGQVCEYLRLMAVNATADTAAKVIPDAIPAPVRQTFVECAAWLIEGPGVVVIEAIDDLTPRMRQAVVAIIAECFGEPLVQDNLGNRILHVYDRDRSKRMSDGARYHQTREGGSLHTDNVNAPDPWEFLVFGCVQPALIGGESVLVHGELVHYLLEQIAPEALDVLRQPFHWEYRGIADALYQAPIITYDAQGRPHYRYLRPYLESAHRKANTPLDARQAWALDVLDSAMELEAMQLRIALRAGDILVTHDSRILHGRTSFADYYESTTIADYEKHPELQVRRTFERAWVKRRLASSLDLGS